MCTVCIVVDYNSQLVLKKSTCIEYSGSCKSIEIWYHYQLSNEIVQYMHLSWIHPWIVHMIHSTWRTANHTILLICHVHMVTTSNTFARMNHAFNQLFLFIFWGKLGALGNLSKRFVTGCIDNLTFRNIVSFEVCRVWVCKTLPSNTFGFRSMYYQTHKEFMTWNAFCIICPL